MTRTLMRLGDFGFSIDTAAFQKLQEVHRWRWEPVSRIGHKPIQHDLGPDAAQIRMQGVTHPYWRGGVGQLDRLKAIGDERRAVLLVDALGIIWGRFVVERLEIEHSVFAAAPTAMKKAFTLVLKEQAPDG